MSEVPVHVYGDKKQALTSAGAVFVFYSRRPPELGGVRWFARHYREHRQKHPGGLGFVAYVEPDQDAKPGIAGDARREFVEALKVGSQGKAAIVVFTASGFVGAAFRAFVGGLLLAVPAVGPSKIAASLDDALPWFLPKLSAAGIGVEEADLRAAIEKLRAATRAGA
jgi:hypothetical protein